MTYIGTEPAAAYTTTTKQTITGTGVATYTLDYDVASEQDIQVFLNNVRQEGGTGKAYTVADNQITFASNIASTDDLYVLFTGKAIQTIVPPDLSITTGMLKDDAVTSAKIADDAVKFANINEDFYKTGTWTPTVSSGTIGIETDSAHYIKIGKLVVAHARIDSFSDTTSNTQIRISGLPYPTGTTQQHTGIGWGDNAIKQIFFYGGTVGNSYVDAYGGGSGYDTFRHSDLNIGDEFLITLTYISQ